SIWPTHIAMTRRSSPQRWFGSSRRTASSDRGSVACAAPPHRRPEGAMLVAGEVKGELARIVPARTCCRRAELAGLLSTDRTVGEVSTFDYGTARIAVQLAASLRLEISGPHPASRSSRPAGG